MKRKSILLVLCGVIMTPVHLFALETAIIDGRTWTYSVTEGKVTLGGGNPTYTAVSTGAGGTIVIPAMIGSYPVTIIGDYAFYDCKRVEKVIIPDSVTRIGTYAFGGCAGLSDLVIPQSVTTIGQCAFKGCAGLGDLVIPQSVTSIGSSAFSECSGLSRMVIPNSVTGIGSAAFAGCSGLREMVLPFVGANRGVTNGYGLSGSFGYIFGSASYDGSVRVVQKYLYTPETIKDKSYYIPMSLRRVVIADETELGYGAFSGCSNLVEIVLAEGVKKVGTCAFSGCSRLTSVTIPDSVTRIGSGAFLDCASLPSITVPKSVTEIFGGAFSGCRGLEKITLPFVGYKKGGRATNGLFGYIFGETLYEGGAATEQIYKDGDKACSKTYCIPLSLRQVMITDESDFASGAFYGCTSLEHISIPNSVGSIDATAFAGCSGLRCVSVPACVCLSRFASMFPDIYQNVTNVVVNDGVSAIGASTFSDCESLECVVIPDSVIRIGNRAFFGCGNLVDVFIGNGLAEIDQEVFSGCDNLIRLNVSEENPHYSEIDGLLLSKDGQTLLAVPWGLKRLVVPEGVSSVGAKALYNYYDLTNVVFSCGLKTIDSNAFYGCTELEGIDFPVGLEKIGDYAFYNCSELSHAHIPNSVTNIGNNAFRGCNGLESVSLPQCLCASKLASVFLSAYQTLIEAIADEGVTNIASRLFDGCANLRRVTMPSSVKYIRTDVFRGCEGFSELEISDIESWVGVEHCGPIGHPYDLILNGGIVRHIDIPSGVESISQWAFSDCVSLESIALPEGLTVIGCNAFSGCDNVSTIHLPSTLVRFGNLDVRNVDIDNSETVDGFRIWNNWILGYDDNAASQIKVPEGIIGIAPYAFADFWDLEEIVLPASLKYIGCCAFINDTYLDNVVIPDGVEYIDGEAFRGCTYLRDIEIGAGVEVIGEMAFANCTQLTSLTVPEGVETIGSCAFSNCWRMLSVKLPLSLESIGENMFASCSSLVGVSAPTGRFTMNQLFGARSGSITSAVIVDGESVMCTNAFANCTSMETVDIPNGVTNIQTEAFRNCTQLRDVSLPETLEVIGEQAFYGCSMLSAIVLPDSVREVGNGVFRGCAALNSITLSRNLAEVPDYAFYGCNNLVSIVVPTSIAQLGAYISNKLTALYFLGNAPAYDANAYSALPSNAKTYVVQGSRGWDGIPSSRDLPSSWIGRSITTWVPNRFYATFDANDGLFPDESATYACEEITDTSYAIPPFEPHRRGYAFAGWWTDRTAGAQIKATTRVNETRDITLYAHWAIVNKPVSVRFYANGGTVEPEEATYYAGLTYETLPVPTKEHYRFTGWYTMADGGTQVLVSSEVPVAGAELFAHWSPETYVIRYNPNGGNGSMADQSFVYGATVTLRANSFWRQNSSFIGWGVSPDGPVVYADQKEISTIGAIQGGVINLYAQWTATRYAIRYDSNGGVGIMTNDTLITGVSAMLSSNLFTRAGYVFIGWATSASGEVLFGDGESVIDLATSANATVSLFAVWARDSSNVAVTFNGDKLWHPARFARNGEVVWQSGDIGDSETSDLIAMVNGSGTVSFDWCCSCEESFRGMRLDYLAFSIDDEEKDYINGSNSWATMSYTINGAGTHVLRWQYTKDSAGAAYEDCARVMSIVWEPSLSTLEEFANATNLAFSTSTNAPWFGQTVVSHDGIAALQSGGISDGETTCLECEVIGPGELSFWWKVSCEEPFRGMPLDYASFEVDGVQQEWIAGETGWTNVIVAIEGLGRHRISWSYQKDEWEGSISGYDCAWVDEIVWTPSVVTDPIPAVAVDADTAMVNATVDGVGFADATVKAAIGGSAAEYNAFKTWADGVKGATGDALAGEAAVVANTHAAAAYLLGAERLFENEPTVEIGELSIAKSESAGTTAMTVAVTVKDGESAVAVSAARVAAMFEATGDLGDWTGAAKLSPKVDISDTDASGKMTFVVTPGDGTAAKAFLRIRR